jgi:lipopolysaccharide export system permease protein
MVAMHSAGVSFYRAVATILIASAAISIFVFFFQNFVVTPANELAGKELAIVKKSKGPGKDIIWQKNLRGKQGYYFIYYFNKEKLSVSGGFHYLEMNGSKPARTLQARKATYNPQTQNWLLEECTLTTFKDPAAIESIQNFNTYETTFPDPIDFFYKPNRDPLELNVVELWNEVQERKQTGSGLVPYAVQFHANISFPFMSFIVAIVGVIAGGMGSLRSSGPLIRSLLLSTATIFIYEMLFRLGVNLGVNGLVPPFVAGWGPTVIFFLTAVYLIWRNRR